MSENNTGHSNTTISGARLISSRIQSKNKQRLRVDFRAALKVVFIAVLAFTFSGCATFKAIHMVTGGATYGNEREKSIVPFTLYGHLILVKVRLNDDQQERTFIVDTGALTVINKSLADTMSFKDDVKIMGIDTSGQKKETRLVEIESFKIGNKEVKNCAASIFDFVLIERAIGIHVDGILGSNILHFFNVTIDYKAKNMALSQNKKSLSQGKYRVPFKQDMTVGFAPVVEAKIENKYALRAIIDTGYDGYVAAIPATLLKKLKYASKEVKGVSGGGAFGVATGGELVRLKAFELGNLPKISNIPVESTKIDKALLGKQFLDKFVVTINYLSNELTLEPYEENLKFRDNIFDIGLRVLYDEQKRAKVIGIVQDSPADKQGIKLDDEIVKINEKQVESYSIPELREMLVLNDEIKHVELVIKRNGNVQAVVLDKAYLFE